MKSVKKGTQLPDALVQELTLHQSQLQASADAATGETAQALQRAADAEGQLAVAIDAGGDNYAGNPTVILRQQSASLTLFTAALASNCAGQ